MKEKFFIFLALVVLIVVLVGLNAASYVQQEKMPDSELAPNRSTYNAGATGTRAFYDLLAETGRKVTRWQEPPSMLLSAGKNKPDTFVIIGTIRRDFEENEIKHILEWVADGGKLVIIDREPSFEIIKTTENWDVSNVPELDDSRFGIDPSDQKQMTDRTTAGKPAQPSAYTVNINAVQPSRFASSVNFTRFADNDSAKTLRGIGSGTAKPPVSKKTPTGNEDYFQDEEIKTVRPTPSKQENGKSANSNQIYKMPTPTPKPLTVIKDAPADADSDEPVETRAQTAPVVHLANDKKNLLVDFPYGSGKIVYLTDPYIVANGGISLVDNAQLAINVVASTDGLIAFDEYHQGYGTNKNQLLTYFAGTPVVAIFLQLAALVGLIFYSQSRRFARAVPEDEPNRLSKLEYVAAMAELQHRTKAFDLAIENIYTDFRRRTARLFGVDNFTTPRVDLARLISERLPSENFHEIDEVLRKCEYIAQGEPTNKKQVVQLAGRLREIEAKLGLQRRKKRRQK